MAEVVEPATTGTNGVSFELDRFVMADGDRFEVNGRWFGVRGRRFMRPSLTLVDGDEQRRLLADLEHKPWAAEDGQPWEAMFPYEQDDGGWVEAELNVAPDITITLPLPGANRRRRRRPAPSSSAITARRGAPSEAAGDGNDSRRGEASEAEAGGTGGTARGETSEAPPRRPGPRPQSWSRPGARRTASSVSSSVATPRSRNCRPSSSAAAPSSKRCPARATPLARRVRTPPTSTSGWSVRAAKR